MYPRPTIPERIRCALNSVSFEIHQNDYVAVVGRSGSGKFTLMNILGLMDQPSEGQYLLDVLQQIKDGQEKAAARHPSY